MELLAVEQRLGPRRGPNSGTWVIGGGAILRPSRLATATQRAAARQAEAAPGSTHPRPIPAATKRARQCEREPCAEKQAGAGVVPWRRPRALASPRRPGGGRGFVHRPGWDSITDTVRAGEILGRRIASVRLGSNLASCLGSDGWAAPSEGPVS